MGVSMARVDVLGHLLRDPVGRAFLGNLLTGTRKGYYTARPIIRLVNEAIDAIAGRVSDSGDAVRTAFASAINERRFNPLSPERFVFAGDPFTRAYADALDLSNENVYHTISLEYAIRLIDSNDRFRFSGLVLPEIDADILDNELEDAFADGIGTTNWYIRSDPDSWCFNVDAGLAIGRRLLWFCRASEYEAILRRHTGPGSALADDVVGTLGLGHLVSREGDWAVRPPYMCALRIPGRILQACGHYRPIALDAVGQLWFMAGSSRRPAPYADWGQTVDLDALERTYRAPAPWYDGGPERVADELHAERLGDTRIELVLLGRPRREAVLPAARTRLLDDIWSRRSLL